MRERDTWKGLLRAGGDVSSCSAIGLSSRPCVGQMPALRYDGRGWRATFYTTGMEHSATSAIGSAWESRPWTAVQRVAAEALAQSRTALAPEDQGHTYAIATSRETTNPRRLHYSRSRA